MLQGRVAISPAPLRRGVSARRRPGAFAALGTRVAILDLEARFSEAAAADIGEGHVGLACDVMNRDDCRRAVAAVLARFGQVDVLVNNAGITQPVRLMDITPEGYQAVTDVTVRGSLYMAQAVVPHWRVSA